MYGRGAVDMKGGIACFVAAVARHVAAKGDLKGSVSLLITGDEEGPAINGTGKLLDWAPARAKAGTRRSSASRPIPTQLGDMIKIGRRGSLSGIRDGARHARAMSPIRISPTIRCAGCWP